MEVPSAGKGGILIRSLDQEFHRYIVKPVLQLYLRRTVRTRHDGFVITVNKGVFHPLIYFSTRYLYEFVGKMELRCKSFLELGCGAGLISMLALRKGAAVTAVDIDSRAVDCTRSNIAHNFQDVSGARVFESDVFGTVPPQAFDVIVVNPPYYFKDVANADQLAWYCGSEGEYFKRFFAQLPAYMKGTGSVLMVLEENCEISRIRELASAAGLQLELADQRRFRWETSFIFRIVKKQPE